MNQTIEFNIYGPTEDKEYWEVCQTLIEGLPSNIQVNYYGSVDHSNIVDVFHLTTSFYCQLMGKTLAMWLVNL